MRAKPMLLLGGMCVLGIAAAWMVQDLGAPPEVVARDTPSIAPPAHENTASPHVELPRLASARVESVPAGSSGETTPVDPVARDKKLLARIDASLADKLRGERIDTAWASDTEASIANAVADPGFAGLHLDAVRCGSTLCRVAITVGDQVDDVAGLVEELTSTRPFRAGGFLRFTGERAVTMFVTRTGTQLPPPPHS